MYDFGANFSGWARLRLHRGEALAGHVVSMIPGEILDRDGNPDQSVTGRGYHWQYTLNGEDVQEYAPKFTYTGFRYLQLRGAVPAGYPAAGQELPTAQTITGEFIYPDFAPAGGFTCSNPLFNSIHKIVTQAMKSNIKGYFTDCPHRERLPWMEQSHLIAPGLMYNFDLRRHYEKIMADIADAQHENGMVPTICPQYVRFGYHRGYNDSPEWGSAAVLNPWYGYLRTGDAQILRRGYAVMCRYVDYLGTQTHHLVLHHGLGDWLDIGPYPPHSQNTPVPVVATCIYHLDLTLVARIAALLGETADAEKYAALAGQVRAEFRAQFLDKQSVRSIFVANGSQAAQAMALMCGLIDADEEQATLLSLASDIEKRGYANTAGDVGHPFVVAALTRYGRGDLMEKMLLNDEQPGYAYQVKHGATTLTEDWDGPNPGGPHGSQNHFMLGAVEEWFYCGLAGLGSLRVDAFSPEMTIRPYFAESCDAVSAWTLHPCGRVAIQWKRLPRGIEVVLTVPPGLRVVFVGGAEDTRTALASGTHCLMLPV